MARAAKANAFLRHRGHVIADDIKSRALPIYFARPIVPLTYLLGKWLVVAAYIGVVMLVPNLLSLMLGVLVTGGLQTVGETARLGFDLIVSGVGVMVVGGALILDGRLYRGSQYVAGEIGQMSIDYKGVDGPYGNFGALERCVGHQQIQELAIRRFQEAGRDPKKSAELESLETLVEAARTGDVEATRVWNDVALYLGTALAGAVYLLNPDAIVIGGGVAHAGDVLFDPLKKQLQSTLSKEFWTDLEVKPAELGNDAGIIGSSALAADALDE